MAYPLFDYIIRDDKYYLDVFHKNYIEVFDKNRNIKVVMNLDGSLNRSKIDKAFAENYQNKKFYIFG